MTRSRKKIIPVNVHLPNRPSTRRTVGVAPEYGIGYRDVVPIVGLNPEYVLSGRVTNRGKPHACWMLVVTSSI